jgi:predicted DNA-binding WGR domain protein
LRKLRVMMNTPVWLHLATKLFVKEWGRIGARGRMVAELYETEALAAAALQRHAERKRRRGYGDVSWF